MADLNVKDEAEEAEDAVVGDEAGVDGHKHRLKKVDSLDRVYGRSDENIKSEKGAQDKDEYEYVARGQ